MKDPLLATLTLLLFCTPSAIPQGMVPISDVIDHTKPPTKPLSPAKLSAHKKIASSNLHTTAKLVIADKPPELSDPTRHSPTDQSLLHFLLVQYPLTASTLEKAEILENLQNFAHKFENGIELIKATNALKEILLPALNSSEASLRKGACSVLAAAAQNNRQVQDEALEVIRPLVHILTFDKEKGVRGSALTAISAMLRNYPKAQGTFVSEGGLPALVREADSKDDGVGRRKALQLIADLLKELEFCRSFFKKHLHFSKHKLFSKISGISKTIFVKFFISKTIYRKPRQDGGSKARCGLVYK
jgi:hypothetical protein